MNIQEMHTAFRTIGQQMGLQLIRGILPESIDVFLNNEIQSTTNEALLTSTTTTTQAANDNQASVMGAMNFLKNLHRSYTIDLTYPSQCSTDTIKQGQGSNVISWDKTKEFEGSGNIDYYNPNNGYHKVLIPIKDFKYNRWSYTDNSWISTEMSGDIDAMMYLSVSLKYAETKKGNYIQCRIVGEDVIDTMLNDFCNTASKDLPIVSLISKSINMKDQPYLNIYINSKNTTIESIILKCIKKPNIVKYDVDINNCVNCDLPEYTHYAIVEKAVEKFKIAIKN